MTDTPPLIKQSFGMVAGIANHLTTLHRPVYDTQMPAKPRAMVKRHIGANHDG